MPFHIDSDRNAPAASIFPRIKGPASSRVRGPTTTNKIVPKSPGELQTPSPSSVPERGTLDPNLFRHKKLKLGNKRNQDRAKQERKEDAPGYKLPHPEDKQFTLPIRPIGFRKPLGFGSEAGSRVLSSKTSGTLDPTGQSRLLARSIAVQSHNAKVRDRRAAKKLRKLGDQQVIDMNRKQLWADKKRIKEYNDTHPNTKVPKKGALMNQEEANLQYRLRMQIEEGIVPDREFVPGKGIIEGRGRVTGKTKFA
jgi:hypothetical protein